MIEIILRNELEKRLIVVPVYMVQPIEKPKTYVVMDKIGSGRKDKLPRTSIAFQSYSDTKYNTALLNQKVIEAVDSMIDLNIISRIEFDSDYPYNDLVTKQDRYQAVFDIYHY